MDGSILEKLGFTPGEIKVYLALLRLGTSTAGPIAREAKVARSKLYDILERLARRGLVSRVVQNGTRRFSVAEPARLKDFLRQRREQLERQEEEIDGLIPALELEYRLKNVRQEAEVFDGLEGLKNAREKYLRSMKRGDAVYFAGVPSSAYRRMEAYYADWNARRIRKGIQSYTIFTDVSRTHPYVKQKIGHKHTFVRFLPKGVPCFAWFEIYGDTVVIAINHEKAFSIVIHDRHVAQSYKTYFDLLWKISRE